MEHKLQRPQMAAGAQEAGAQEAEVTKAPKKKAETKPLADPHHDGMLDKDRT